jgi:hypothetical protein
VCQFHFYAWCEVIGFFWNLFFWSHSGLQAEQRIEEEAQRAKKYLDSSSHEKLKREVDIVLIDRHREVLQIECEAMIRDERISGASFFFFLLISSGSRLQPTTAK